MQTENKEVLRQKTYSFGKTAYDVYVSLFELVNMLPKAIKIDGNAPRIQELINARDDMLQIHRDTYDSANKDLI